MARDLEKALEQAQESEARTRRFLADAAHQLRNPIAGIRACADTFLRTNSGQDRERLLELLVAESLRATGLVNSLLRIARLDRGEALELKPCDLQEICEQEAERIRLQAPELDVVVRIDPSLNSHPRLDADTVREVLANLLDNARRYAAHRIEVSATRTPSAHPEDQIIELRVKDDGPGLAAHMVNAAFERFTTLDPKGGSGLGLPIAKGLARAHEGDLNYVSGEFVLRIPEHNQNKIKGEVG